MIWLLLACASANYLNVFTFENAQCSGNFVAVNSVRNDCNVSLNTCNIEYANVATQTTCSIALPSFSNLFIHRTVYAENGEILNQQANLPRKCNIRGLYGENGLVLTCLSGNHILLEYFNSGVCFSINSNLDYYRFIEPSTSCGGSVVILSIFIILFLVI